MDRLAAICSELRRATALLDSPTPDNLARCSERLDAAFRLLTIVRSDPVKPDDSNATLAEILDLQSALRRASFLLENAAEFHAAWRRIVGSMCSGYRADGESAPVMRPARVCISC